MGRRKRGVAKNDGQVERLVSYCRTTRASTAPRTPQRTCCPHASVLATVVQQVGGFESFVPEPEAK